MKPPNNVAIILLLAVALALFATGVVFLEHLSADLALVIGAVAGITSGVGVTLSFVRKWVDEARDENMD